MSGSLLLVASRAGGDEICRVLNRLPVHVRCCDSGSTALKLATEAPPNLMLIDARADPSSSIQICRSVRSIEATSATPLIVLTGATSSELRLGILEAGADDCWTEQVDSREFVLRLQSFSRRLQSHPASPVLRYADVELNIDRYRARRNGVPLDLTSMQLRLLKHFMENPAIVFSRQRLLEEVWGNPALDKGAVTACVVRLRRALNAAGGPNLIKSIPSAGYMLEAEFEAAAWSLDDAALRHL